MHYTPSGDGDDGRLLLQLGAGAGSSCSQDWDFWVYPLPPDGPVTLVGAWLGHGIGESSAELDGAAIRAAASRAELLWPEDPEFEPEGSWRRRQLTAFAADEPGTSAGPGEPDDGPPPPS